ncbi:hypothetical protein Tco_0637507 [Tanacetum coccineum]
MSTSNSTTVGDLQDFIRIELATTGNPMSEVAVIASAAVAAVGGSKMEMDKVRGWPTVVDIRGEGVVGSGIGGVVLLEGRDDGGGRSWPDSDDGVG